MHILRTPDARFQGLADFPYEPNYSVVHTESGDALRIAWVTDGPADGEPVLLLHGASGWSYQYRNVIPALASAGLRTIAVDLVGSGRSDKPAAHEDYSVARHVEWLRQLAFDELDLHAVTIVMCGWAGMSGLRLVAAHSSRFARIATANAFVPTDCVLPPAAFMTAFAQVGEAAHTDFGAVASAWAFTPFEAHVMDAYNAPFLDDSYKIGVLSPYRTFAAEAADVATNSATTDALSRLDLPALVASSDGDVIAADYAQYLRELLPGSRLHHQPCYRGAGLIVEDAPLDLAQDLVDFIGATPRLPAT